MIRETRNKFRCMLGRVIKIGLKAIGLNFYEEKLLLMGYLGDGLKNLS